MPSSTPGMCHRPCLMHPHAFIHGCTCPHHSLHLCHFSRALIHAMCGPCCLSTAACPHLCITCALGHVSCTLTPSSMAVPSSTHLHPFPCLLFPMPSIHGCA